MATFTTIASCLAHIRGFVSRVGPWHLHVLYRDCAMVGRASHRARECLMMLDSIPYRLTFELLKFTYCNSGVCYFRRFLVVVD